MVSDALVPLILALPMRCAALLVEAVDFRDLVSLAHDFRIEAASALTQLAMFAENVMSNFGARDLVTRVQQHLQGQTGRPPSEVEQAALAFERDRKYANAADLLVAINKEGARAHRPDILRACMRALQSSSNTTEPTAFYDAVIRMREQSRLQGRPLPARAVGSTLLLKGLEAEVAVILHADELDARNLYVAMTRSSKHLVVCARQPILCG